MTPAQHFSNALAATPGGVPSCLGLAVSGGGDSMAMMVLARDWAAEQGVSLHVVAVDHGLRPESAAESQCVVQAARQLGISAQVLIWADHPKGGNLQAAARNARRELIASWANAQKIKHVALAHTLDDQAETLLLRLARGSGVDGLSAMRPIREDQPNNLTWLRPLLSVRRDALRDVLRNAHMDWVEDPSNQDTRFDRVKARQMLGAPPLPGLSADRLAQTATRMRAAQQVLVNAAQKAASDIVCLKLGAVRIDRSGLAMLEDDTRWRLLSAALCLVSSQAYRPRLASLQMAEEAALQGRAHSLHACLLYPDKDALWVLREPAALKPAPAPGLWDGRWKVSGPVESNLYTAPLGKTGLAAMGDWRDLEVPYVLAQGLPGIWQGQDLLAAPVMDQAAHSPCPWDAQPVWDAKAFNDMLFLY